MAVAGRLNVILHGLLFLEFKNGGSSPQLQITAPDLNSNHDLLMGVPGNLQNINFKEIHWEDPSLNLTGGPPGLPAVNGIPTDVPDSIFQFSRQTTNVGDIDRSHIQGKIFLPWPAHWDTIRRGDLPALGTRLPNKPPDQWVHADIGRRCGKKIGVATVLTYTYPLSFPPIPGWSPSANIEIYFQPRGRETIADVNADLRAASFQLFSSDNFDLAIVDTVGNASTSIGQTPFIPNSGLSIGDELSLNEDVEVVDPKDPPLDDNQKKAVVVIQDYLNTRPLNIFMASPANCPTLFLGG